jgi:tryptophan-rich sensory protein
MLQNKSEKFKLFIAIGICLAAGLLGSVFTVSSVGTWYRALLKPSANPPSWVFGAVWTVLYVMMGIALFEVWKQRPLGKEQTRGITWFFIQLFLNVLWSFFFFYMRQPGLAFFEIILFWLAIATTLWMFARRSLTAAALLLPYLAWVSFATYLNFAIWRLNS